MEHRAMYKLKLWLELDHIKINPLRLSKRCESIQKERKREGEREAHFSNILTIVTSIHLCPIILGMSNIKN